MPDSNIQLQGSVDVVSPQVVGGKPVTFRVQLTNLGDDPVSNITVRPVSGHEVVLRESVPAIPTLGAKRTHKLDVTFETRKRWLYSPATYTVDFNIDVEGQGTVATATASMTPSTPVRSTILGALLGVAGGMILYQLLYFGAPTFYWLIDFIGYLQFGRIEGAPPLLAPFINTVFLAVITTGIAVFLAFFLQTGGSSAPKVGITVSGWTGALVVGFLTPWIGRPLFDQFFAGMLDSVIPK